MVIDDDPDARLARTLVSWGVPHIAGSSRTAETLARAGLAGATAVVLRIFDPQLARSVKNSFGFTSVRSTAALAAPWFVGAALGLDVLSTFYAGDEPLLVARLTITPQGGLHGLAMHELAVRTRVLAIRRAADKAILEHPPRRSTRFRPDDEAYLIGPYEELLTVLRRDRPNPKSPQSPGPVQPGRPRPRDGR